ncbi:MAG: hypothetical protein KGL39_12100 [Patescibacteria group bacterium]|nr:hypothetical protein [Patescibacteria group bacterium]
MYKNRDFLAAVEPAFSASSPIATLFMPTDGVITETRLSFDVHVNIPTSGSPAFTTLGLFQAMFTLLTITAAGATFLSVQDPLVALTHQRMRGIPVVADNASTSTTGSDVKFHAELLFHWGSHPRNPWDLTGGIPAQDYSQGGLVLNMTWPANTAAGTNSLTIDNTTKFRLHNKVVLMSDAEYAALKASGRFAVPSFTESDYALSNYSTASTGYLSTINLPVGQFLRGLTILQENSSGDPTDANLNQMGLFSGGQSNDQVITGDWIDLAQDSHVASGDDLIVANTMTVGGTNPGMAYLDFQKQVDARTPGIANGIFGANLTNVPLGQRFLGFSVQTATGTLKLFNEQLTPTAQPQ